MSFINLLEHKIQIFLIITLQKIPYMLIPINCISQIVLIKI